MGGELRGECGGRWEPEGWRPGAGERRGRAGVHPAGAPAAQIRVSAAILPQHAGTCPSLAPSHCLNPSFLPFLFSPLLPYPGPGAPGEGGAAWSGEAGGGELPLGSDSRQAQPPHPHDLHREGSPGDGGGEGLAGLHPPPHQPWLQAPAFLGLHNGPQQPRGALTSAPSPGGAASWALLLLGPPPP